MKLANLQDITFIDYPKEIASIIFTVGCNFNCEYCYNRDLVNPSEDIVTFSQDEILSKLKNNRYIDGVVITGGEPTIQSGLIQFIEKIRLELDLKIKLDTNGYKSSILKEIIDKKLINYIAMDWKSTLSEYDEICGCKVDKDEIMKSVELIKNSGLDHEFRTTVWKNNPFLKSYKDKINLDVLKNSDFYLQNFYNGLDVDGFDSLHEDEVKELVEYFTKENVKIKLRNF